MISVLIATRNRPQQLLECLTSILKNKFKLKYEVLIADQSDNFDTHQIFRKLNKTNVSYYKLNSYGKTKGINHIILKAKGNLLVFTDDDNIVSDTWLNKIHKSFKSIFKIDKKAAGIFGKILAYDNNHTSGKECPSTFEVEKKLIVKSPYIVHYQDIGLGNNMMLKKSILNEVGYFKLWLGPGFLNLSGGEDGEIIYRILKRGYHLYYDPSILVFHNRWMFYRQHRFYQTKYTIGHIAFNFYYFLLGDAKIFKLIVNKITERFSTIYLKKYFIMMLKFKFRSIFRHRHELITEIHLLILECSSLIQGFIIGGSAYFAKKLNLIHKKYES